MGYLRSSQSGGSSDGSAGASDPSSPSPDSFLLRRIFIMITTATMMMTITIAINRSVIMLNGRNGMTPAALVGVGVGVTGGIVVGTGVGGLIVNNPKTVVWVIFALAVLVTGLTVV